MNTPPFLATISPTTSSRCVKFALGALLCVGLRAVYLDDLLVIAESPDMAMRHSLSDSDGTHVVHGVHRQLEGERSLACVPSLVPWSGPGLYVYVGDLYECTLGGDRDCALNVRPWSPGSVRDAY